MNAVTWPRVYFSSGACEALKWLALISMVVDHVNKALFDSSIAWAVPVGRLAMPIFSLLIAYNLARPHVDAGKMLRRLVLAGLVAAPFHSSVNGGGWLPLNVLFTFAIATALIWSLENGLEFAGSAFAVLAALFVDYMWPGVFLVVSAWWYFKRPGGWPLWFAGASFVAMCALVGNAWVLLALPVIAVASVYAPHVPRLRWFFWAFYPAHLALLWMLQQTPNY